jgi:hypothetical protein
LDGLLRVAHTAVRAAIAEKSGLERSVERLRALWASQQERASSLARELMELRRV